MNNNLTELVLILDMSGSMADLRADTVGGVNTVLRDQKDKEGDVLVTTVVFNNFSKIVHDRLPLSEVPEMKLADYMPSGCTALIDALGTTIKHIAGIHRYARPEDVPANTIFVITTDGLENASTEFSADEVRKMIEHEKEKYGWEFIFLAANIDAVETARRYGIDSSRAVSYHNDSAGSDVKFRAAGNAIRAKREGLDLSSPCCASWRAEADEDYKSR